MSKPVKISLVLLALIVVVISAGVLFLVTFDPNNHRERIVNQFERSTGLTLALDGNIELSLYPWLGVGVEGVAIGQDARFGDEPLVSARNARVRVKTLPLLRGRYEIDTVVLEGARLYLVVDESGLANWSGTATASATDEASTPAQGGGLPLNNIVLGGVDIQDATVRFEDRRSGAVYELSDIDVSVDALTYGAPVNLAASLELAANQPQIQGSAGLTGVLNYDLDNGQYSVSPFQLTADLSGPTLPSGASALSLDAEVLFNRRDDSVRVGSLRFEGLDMVIDATAEGQNLSTSRASYQAGFTAGGEDLAVLFRAIGVESLATQLGGLADRSFSLEANGTFESASEAVNFRLIDGQVLGSDLSGAFRAAGLGTERAEIAGLVNASGPDFPLLVEVAGQFSGGSDSLLSRAGREMRGVPSRSFSIDASFDADIGAGVVSVPTLEASIIGASLSGSLNASELQTEQPKIAGNLSTEGPDLPLFIAIAAWFQAGGGTDSELFQLAERLGAVTDKSFSASADFDVDLERGNVSVPKLDARALGLTLSGQLAARDMNNRGGSVDGALTLEGSRPAELLRALEQAELADVLQRLALNVRLSGSRENLGVNPLHAELVLAGNRIPGSPATLALDAATRIDLERESLAIDSFRATGLGLNANGAIRVDSFLDAPSFEGRLALAEFDLRDFLRQLGQAVPETTDPNVLRTVGVETTFTGSMNSARLSGLSLTLDETSLRGSLAVGNFEKFPAEFDLDIDRIDLDRYLPPAAANQPTTTAQSEPGTLPIDSLRDLTLNGDLRVGELTVAGVHLSSLRLSVDAANGQLSLAPVSTNLYEGAFEGAVRLSVAEATPVARIEADLQRVNLEPLLADLMDASYVTGRGNVQLALTGRGEDADAIKRSLGGNGRIQLEDGILRGVDVAGVLTQLETMIRSRRPGNLQRGEQTAFDTFGASLAVQDGVITTNDLMIKSPGFQVAGRGTLLNLAEETIAFDLVASVDNATSTRNDQEYDIGGYALPIACTGSLEEPRCLPDAGEILRNAVQRELQDRVIDLLDRNLGRGDQQGQVAPQSGTQQTAPQTAPQQTAPQQTTPQQTTPQQQQPQDVREQIINRALDRIFN